MGNKKKSLLYYLFCLIGILFLVGLDQVTKQLAVQYLKNQEAIELIPGVFELTYLENTGAAFGIFRDKQWLFVGGSVIITAVILVFFIKLPKTKKYLPFFITMAVVLAGAIGNMIDRLAYGYVVDFFYFSLIDFPVFNVADIYITVGAAVFALLYILCPEEEMIG